MNPHRRVVWIVWVMLGLALLSWMTTDQWWSGGYPSGEVRLNIKDESGSPIPGARLRVFQGSTRRRFPGTSGEGQSFGDELISNAQGKIVAVSTFGKHFGGRTWYLWWMVPIGARSPNYECEIAADGYRTSRFPIRRSYESPYLYYSEFPKSNMHFHRSGEALQIYENDFVLKR